MSENKINSISIQATQQRELRDLVEHVLAAAKAKGATQVEVGASIDAGLSTTVRMGNVDKVEFNRDKGIGITVYFGQKRGAASTSDTTPKAIEATVQAACDIAQVTVEDEYAGLPEKELIAFDYPDLDLYYPWAIAPEEAIEVARQCEDFGLQYDKRITNSEGAELSTLQTYHVYGNSLGFMGCYPTTRHNISCVLVASEGKLMQRDYYYTDARDAKDLFDIEMVATTAAKRALDRLNGQKLSTRKAPVLFTPEVAKSLFGTFIAAIKGGNLYRRSSFLLDHLCEMVFPEHINIHEEPHILKGLGSAPFDSEGVVTVPRHFVKNGRLESYVLSSYTARRLGMQTTGNAGGVRNLTINNSDKTLTDLLQQMHTGLLLTEVFGQGINLVTGDYSRGAAGFWVENGEIQYPVHEITIAGNLAKMFQQIVAVGNDVDARGNIRTGSVLIEEMMIAGQ